MIDIDVSRLSEDYQSSPTKEDLEYLYLELNLSPTLLKPFFIISGTKLYNLLKKYNLKKSKEMVIASKKLTCMEKFGAPTRFQASDFKEKADKTKIEKYGDVNYNNSKKRKETNLEKYGAECPYQNEEIKKKGMETNKNRHNGVYFQSTKDWVRKTQDTMIERYGDLYNRTEEFYEKSRKTKLERYNDENFNNREKAKQTNLERHGSTNYYNHEKAKQTNLERYGVDFPIQNSLILQKRRDNNIEKYGLANPIQLQEIKEKIKETNLERYGVENYSSSKECRDKVRTTIIERYGEGSQDYDMAQRNLQFIIYEKRKKSQKFASSKPEERIYQALLTKFPDCQHSYRDERYPFNCDFYIPSLDLFIELNFHWTHGNHPYNENCSKDQEIVSIWKQKSFEFNCKGKLKEFYKNAIHTWTVRDVKKQQTANSNKLNYLAFYNEKEFGTWFEGTKE